ncbi:MAG: anaerobic ribonucleoside-triphosphate reductase activating protein [Methanimicrococcus sp.]|nr:anaerobic ribonucleoside-triphosphate reductase activating protein [Methanimicrococcus sp.]
MQANIGGIVPLSTVDWHGRSAVVIFFEGCPFRCGYCHNHHLLDAAHPVDSERVQKRILESKPFVSAVVFSGGEPLLQAAAVEEIAAFSKANDLRVGIHTNGFYPEAVSDLINKGLADKFFIDIKAPLTLPSHEKVIGFSSPTAAPNIAESIKIVDSSSLELEVKTTVFPDIAGSKEDIRLIAKWLSGNVLQKQKMTYVLQQGKGQNTNDSAFQEMAFLSPAEMDELAKTTLQNLEGAAVFTQTDEEGRVGKF